MSEYSRSHGYRGELGMSVQPNTVQQNACLARLLSSGLVESRVINSRLIMAMHPANAAADPVADGEGSIQRFLGACSAIHETHRVETFRRSVPRNSLYRGMGDAPNSF